MQGFSMVDSEPQQKRHWGALLQLLRSLSLGLDEPLVLLLLLSIDFSCS